MNLTERIVNPPESSSSLQKNNAKPLTGIRLFGHLVCAYPWALVKLNVLFVVSCVPIITIPVALAAMADVLGMVAGRRMVFVWRDYWCAWKRLWRRAYAVGTSYCAAMLLAMIGVRFYLNSGLTAGVILAGVCGVLAIWGFVAGAYLFAMIANTALRPAQVWRNAVLLVIARFQSSLLVMVFDSVILMVVFLLMPWTVAVFPLFGLSLIGIAGAVMTKESLAALVLK
ncbi:DUF624 domain-containing protein [Bifidobacterium eulemuris]|uniref:DUF624 domain-containing protein n=1 Tax=Bifidobacterium eulemuris TaxID=1765219 RepID=A0A261G8H4_9BIFI|nr:DUF624 domain-containing protein [Bifidobacterium eulemuris]OZG67503.1 hypothetical protein BEUL_1594 [Bifidobacterium eulemuris]QOL31044.1 DUF624 domain-containing protein [Bifidobacterium eulemuris]